MLLCGDPDSGARRRCVFRVPAGLTVMVCPERGDGLSPLVAGCVHSIAPSCFAGAAMATYATRPGRCEQPTSWRRLRCFHPHNQYLANGEVNTQNGELAHTLERAIEREDLAKQGSETLLQIPLADIRDPRRAASPRQMQRSRIPLSSPMSVCI